ncbi:hypothetical protein GF318_02090 [Candidatus Micrarchaeota archaeon]|nr:hypothetical protein [Candidatus Micrarchaeota archaeon]
MAKEIRISLLGHKDHGKSTLIGRLLYDTRSITEDRINEARATSKSLGKDFEYAFLLDSFEEEREGGFTLDTTRAQVHHNGVIYELIDVPGHKELVKNMLTGASLAHAAILIVSAQPDERLRDETKLHLYLASLLGIKNLVVTINKMDTISYDEQEFNKIRDDITEILTGFGYEKLAFVPVSAKEGDNVSALSEATPWYKGKTVLQYMQEFSDIDYEKELKSLPARMFVQDVYDMGGEKILVGRLDTGTLSVGDMIAVEPAGIERKIEQMMLRQDVVDKAEAGQNIGLKLEENDGIQRGNVCMPADNKTKPTSSIKAKIFCLPGNGVKAGERLTITCASQEAEAEISVIIEKMNPISDKEPKKGVSEIDGWESAQVEIKLGRPMVFESFSEVPHTGRFVLSRDNIIAVGVVE